MSSLDASQTDDQKGDDMQSVMSQMRSLDITPQKKELSVQSKGNPITVD